MVIMSQTNSCMENGDYKTCSRWTEIYFFLDNKSTTVNFYLAGN